VAHHASSRAARTSASTSATIPGEFLQPATKTGGELLARERSRNQTITALPSFSTK
jgi:hypothetical protein